MLSGVPHAASDLSLPPDVVGPAWSVCGDGLFDPLEPLAQRIELRRAGRVSADGRLPDLGQLAGEQCTIWWACRGPGVPTWVRDAPPRCSDGRRPLCYSDQRRARTPH